jgi:flagella basal body P-ring formation protein FlgA
MGELARQAIEDVLPQGVEVVRLNWHQRLRIPRGEVAVVAHLVSEEPRRGRLRVRLEVLVDDVPQRVVPLALRVRDRRPVVVATRSLRRGETIGPRDVELREPPPESVVDQPLRALESVIGSVASRGADAGEVIQRRAIRPPLAVRRRQPVRLVARAGGVEVVALGEPLQDGAVGDLVRVTCLASRRVLLGRVVASGLVEVQ